LASEARLREEMASIRATADRLNARIAELRATPEGRVLDERIGVLRRKIEDFPGLMASAKETGGYDGAMARLELLKERVTTLAEQINAARAAGKADQAAAMRTELEKAKAERAQVAEHIQAIRATFNAYKADMEAAKAELGQAEAALTSLASAKGARSPTIRVAGSNWRSRSGPSGRSGRHRLR
jgi:chromosome segregation ATPase